MEVEIIKPTTKTSSRIDEIINKVKESKNPTFRVDTHDHERFNKDYKSFKKRSNVRLVAGGALGAGVGTTLADKVLKKTKYRIDYLKSKGNKKSNEEELEYKKLKRKYYSLKTVGGVAGAGAGVGLASLYNKQVRPNKKKYNTYK